MTELIIITILGALLAQPICNFLGFLSNEFLGLIGRHPHKDLHKIVRERASLIHKEEDGEELTEKERNYLRYTSSGFKG